MIPMSNITVENPNSMCPARSAAGTNERGTGENRFSGTLSNLMSPAGPGHAVKGGSLSLDTRCQTDRSNFRVSIVLTKEVQDSWVWNVMSFHPRAPVLLFILLPSFSDIERGRADHGPGMCWRDLPRSIIQMPALRDRVGDGHSRMG